MDLLSLRNKLQMSFEEIQISIKELVNQKILLKSGNI